MHDTAEPSIGALSVLHGLCTIWGFFLFRVLAALLVALIKIPMHFYRKSTILDVSSPDPRLSSYPWASTKVRDIYGLCSGRGQVSPAPGGSFGFHGEQSAGNSRGGRNYFSESWTPSIAIAKWSKIKYAFNFFAKCHWIYRLNFVYLASPGPLLSFLNDPRVHELLDFHMGSKYIDDTK